MKSWVSHITILLLSLFLMAPNPMPALAGACNVNSFSGGVDCIRSRVVGTDSALQGDNLGDVFKNVVLLILAFAAMIALTVLIWGGVKYMTSLGEEDATRKAKLTIFYAIVGLLVIGLSFAVIATIGTILTEGAPPPVEP